jgi:hypothetical protein
VPQKGGMMPYSMMREATTMTTNRQSSPGTGDDIQVIPVDFYLLCAMQDSLASLKRGLSQTKTIDRGSFAQYVETEDR